MTGRLPAAWLKELEALKARLKRARDDEDRARNAVRNMDFVIKETRRQWRNEEATLFARRRTWVREANHRTKERRRLDREVTFFISNKKATAARHSREARKVPAPGLDMVLGDR